MDVSLRKSAKNGEGSEAYQNWSYDEIATAGAAIVVSAAPAAGLPFFAGGLTTAGKTIMGFSFGGGALIPIAVTAAATTAVVFAAGPMVRARAVSRVKAKFKSSVHENITERVLGKESGSLKQRLISELYCVVQKRLEVLR